MSNPIENEIGSEVILHSNSKVMAIVYREIMDRASEIILQTSRELGNCYSCEMQEVRSNPWPCDYHAKRDYEANVLRNVANDIYEAINYDEEVQQTIGTRSWETPNHRAWENTK